MNFWLKSTEVHWGDWELKFLGLMLLMIISGGGLAVCFIIGVI